MSQRKIKKQRNETRVLEDVGISNDNLGTGLISVVRKIVTKELVMLLIIIGLAVVIYFNSLHGDFVSDDYASITQNPQISDFWFMFNHGNMMSFSTYIVNLLFGNANPIPYHLLNLLIFIIFCLVSFVFLEVVFQNKWLTRLTMLLFVWHPIHAEAVSWISGRIYLILSVYVMIGLIGFVFYIRENNPKYLLITLISFAGGFVTDRPRPFAVFLLMFVYLMAYGIRKVKVNWSKLALGVLGVFIVGIVFAWPNIMNRIGIVNGGYNASESIFYNPFFQYPTGLSKYFQLLWFPIDLTLYHTMYIFPVWLNYLILGLYLVLLGYFYFKNKPYFFALAFIVAAVLPSIMPVKVSWLVAERYMFLGSLGFCIFIALLILDLSRFSKFVVPISMGFFMSFFGIQLFLRNDDWSTNHKLWVNTCQVSPNSHNAWNNIGDDYDKLNDPMNAIKGFTQSTVVKPNYADAYHNRANIFYKIGRLDLARDSYMAALYYSPGLYQTYLSLAQIDMMEGKFELAVEHSKKAIEISPNSPQNYLVLAVAYAQGGNLSEAEKILKQILSVYPNYKAASDALIQIQISSGAKK